MGKANGRFFGLQERRLRAVGMQIQGQVDSQKYVIVDESSQVNHIAGIAAMSAEKKELQYYDTKCQ